jgi:putative acetyltransferase
VKIIGGRDRAVSDSGAMHGLVAREEGPADFDAIDAVVRGAFNGESEVALVHALRADACYRPELALVATLDERVVAHVMLSRTDVLDGDTRHEVVTLAPMSVHPDSQNRGLGSFLIPEVVARADRAAVPLIVLEGIPTYYPRFGFRRADLLGITIKLPSWASPEAAQALPLRAYDPAIKGTVRLPPPFDLVTDASPEP